MKSRRIIIILLLLVPLCLVPALGQDEGTGDSTRTDSSTVGEKETPGGERVVPGDRDTIKDTTDSGTEKTVEREDTRLKKKAETVKKKTVVRKKQPVSDKKAEPKQEEQSDEDESDLTSGLLFVPEDTLKIKRIPGITVEEEAIPENSIVKVPSQEEEIEPEKDKKGGIFGIGKKKTESLVKWAFLLFILLIFILYKTRSRKSSKKVVRSFTRR